MNLRNSNISFTFITFYSFSTNLSIFIISLIFHLNFAYYSCTLYVIGDFMKKENNSKFWKLLFVIYIIVIAKLVFFRPGSIYTLTHWSIDTVYNKIETANFVAFHTIKLYLRGIYPMISIINLVGNVVVFIPLGFFITKISRKKSFFSTMFKSLAFILLIEFSQLIGTVGEFDVDDIILNIIGAFIGYIIFALFNGTKNKKKATGN